jgi:N-acetylglucosaminyl-diphospho-decaprenol L-rhamnosyltransferase
MSVDVVIVSYASEATLPGTIAAVRSWSGCGEVVVVDNASPDDSVTVASGLADTVVANRRNLGFGAAQNQGVARTTTPIVLLLNPDARVVAADLDAGQRAFAANPRVAMVEGRILRERDGLEERWFGAAPGLRDLVARLLRLRERLGEDRLRRWARRAGAAHYDDRSLAADREVDFLAAVAPMVRREAFEAVGGFDEQIFLYAEDVDLGRRLRKAGWSLLAIDRPWAVHVGGASSAATPGVRDRAWWTSHRYVVSTSWTGVHRWAGLAVTGLGLAAARRRLTAEHR